MNNNLKEIKETTKLIFDDIDIKPISNDFPWITSHPFTDSVFVQSFKREENLIGMANILEDENAFHNWRNFWFEKIEKAKRVQDIFFMIRDPWKLTLLKYWKDDLDNKTFSVLFSEAWVLSENPNGDVNCSINELIKWFKYSKKEFLMEADDLKVFNELPNRFEVYRGVSVNRNPKGLSWTRDISKASWFAHRFDNKKEKGYIQKAEITKNNVLAYFNTRNEEEVVVDSVAIKNAIIKIKG